MRNITPTPWRIGAIESGMVAIDGANGEEVTGFVFPEDGRLIAAAPDLFELIAEWLSSQGNDKNYMTEKARAALAKATGDHP